VITGAGGNFGREGCCYFARRGARIAALDMNPSALTKTKEKVSSECFAAISGKQQQQEEASSLPVEFFFLAVECDVTKVESVRCAIWTVVEKFRRIDMLWNNAGYQGKIEPTLSYDINDFALVMQVNVTGMFSVLQVVAQQMEKQHQQNKQEEGGIGGLGVGGSIVNTSSVAGLRGTPAMVAYSSSKAAVLAMTVSTSKDLAPFGIRVNAVSPALIGPGYMWTRQNELHAASGSPYFATDPETVANNKVNSVPMKRLGTVDEVIKSVAFLLSDDASYTTGTNLVVDGGMSGGLKA